MFGQGWTPEIFDTEMRGTACGIASGRQNALSVEATADSALLLCSALSNASAVCIRGTRTDPIDRGGMLAPLVGGILLSIDRALPVYAAVVMFFGAGICVLFLSEQPRRAGGPTFVH
jgi:hypothetical protein